MTHHVVPHSEATAHVKRGLQKSGKVNAVHLLTGKEFESVAGTLADDLRNDDHHVEVEFIDTNDLSDVVDTIARIAHQNPEEEIHINITGSPNIVAGGATAAAIYLGATPYYVPGPQNVEESNYEGVMELPTPTEPLSFEIEGLQRDVLQAIAGLEEVSQNGVILGEIGDELNEASQKISYHANKLEEKGFIESGDGLLEPSVDGRTKIVHLTEFGCFYLQCMSGE